MGNGMARFTTPRTKGPEEKRLPLRTGTSLWEGVSYRGGVGQWAWILHRVAGLGILLFLVLHIVDIFLAAFGPTVFNKLVFIYHSLALRPLIALLVFGVVYHALNGLRIILMDFWPRMTAYQKPMWVVSFAISLGVTALSVVSWFPVA